MSQGHSIQLFLVNGSPKGLLTAEIMNWTGHVLTGPRTKLAELEQRPESKRTGVCFLVGSDPDGGHSKGIKVQAKEIEGQFVVLAGSSARAKLEGAAGGYESLYEQLCASETLVKTESGQRTFTMDTVFSSPSAAAVVVAGRSSNGRIS